MARFVDVRRDHAAPEAARRGALLPEPALWRRPSAAERPTSPPPWPGSAATRAYVSVIPANAIGDACVAELRRHGIDTSRIVRKGARLGIYFLEAGANQRPSVVIYDRAGAAIAEARTGDIDWDAVFAGATWFHITGHHARHLAVRRGSLPGGRARGEGRRASRSPAT